LGKNVDENGQPLEDDLEDFAPITRKRGRPLASSSSAAYVSTPVNNDVSSNINVMTSILSYRNNNDDIGERRIGWIGCWMWKFNI
jgi:hypothetical protein